MQLDARAVGMSRVSIIADGSVCLPGELADRDIISVDGMSLLCGLKRVW